MRKQLMHPVLDSVYDKDSKRLHVWRTKILTLYPEMFPGALSHSVSGRALKSKIWALETINIRNFGFGKHKNVDGSPAGGGPGMILRADVIDKAVTFATKKIELKNENWPIIFLTPRGKKISHKTTKKLSKKKGLIIVCGRFEGIDERVIKKWGMLELSIGDFVISGGELAAMTLIDSCVRHLPHVLGNQESSKEESFSDGLLEYPQYTQPASWKGIKIPDVLLRGNHKKIDLFRKKRAMMATKKRRPDLWKKYKKNTKVCL